MAFDASERDLIVKGILTNVDKLRDVVVVCYFLLFRY